MRGERDGFFRRGNLRHDGRAGGSLIQAGDRGVGDADGNRATLATIRPLPTASKLARLTAGGPGARVEPYHQPETGAGTIAAWILR